jgi:hypothetical protein
MLAIAVRKRIGLAQQGMRINAGCRCWLAQRCMGINAEKNTAGQASSRTPTLGIQLSAR